MDTVASEQTHPYTDVSQIKQKGDFSCINFSCGYYNMHSNQEFVVLQDVENSIWMAEDLVNKLGYKKYEYIYKAYKYDWKSYNSLSDIDEDEQEYVEDESTIVVGDNILTFDSIGLSIKDKISDDLIFFDGDQIQDLFEVLKKHLDY